MKVRLWLFLQLLVGLKVVALVPSVTFFADGVSCGGSSPVPVLARAASPVI